MAEWLKALAWKACIRETVSWVRIPLPPPIQAMGDQVESALAVRRSRIWLVAPEIDRLRVWHAGVFSDSYVPKSPRRKLLIEASASEDDQDVISDFWQQEARPDRSTDDRRLMSVVAYCRNADLDAASPFRIVRADHNPDGKTVCHERPPCFARLACTAAMARHCLTGGETQQGCGTAPLNPLAVTAREPRIAWRKYI
jgi:hypothetical protein